MARRLTAAQSHVGPSVSRGLCTVHSSRTLCTGSRTTVPTTRPCQTASKRYTGLGLPRMPMYLQYMRATSFQLSRSESIRALESGESSMAHRRISFRMDAAA